MSRRPRPVLRNRPKRPPVEAECEFCGKPTYLAALRWIARDGTHYPACARCAATEKVHSSTTYDDTREDAIR